MPSELASKLQASASSHWASPWVLASAISAMPNKRRGGFGVFMSNRCGSILKQSLGKNSCFLVVFRHFSRENDIFGWFWSVFDGYLNLEKLEMRTTFRARPGLLQEERQKTNKTGPDKMKCP